MRTLCLVALVLSAACADQASDDQRAPALTRRQRDSAIGASRLPGAGGVRRALAGSDSADARNARLDSLAKQP